MRAEFIRISPASEQELLTLLAEKDPDSAIYSGGTDILVYLRSGKMACRRLIDIKSVPGISEISENDNAVCIGACATMECISHDPLVREWAPALAKGCSLMGSLQIRNKATIGGNVMTAAPSGDALCPLFGLDSIAVVKSVRGERKIPISEFVAGFRKTLAESDEFLSRIEIPKFHWSHQDFFKVGRRNALAISLLNGAVAVNVEDGLITKARIALGSAAPVTIRVKEAEEYLLGKPLTEETAGEAGKIITASVHPRSSIRGGGEYRRYIAGISAANLLKSFIREADYD